MTEWRGKSSMDSRSMDIEDIKKFGHVPGCEPANRASRRLLDAASTKPRLRRPGEFTNTLEADEWLETERIRQKHAAKRREDEDALVGGPVIMDWSTPRIVSGASTFSGASVIHDEITTLKAQGVGFILQHEPENDMVDKGNFTFQWESSGIFNMVVTP